MGVLGVSDRILDCLSLLGVTIAFLTNLSRKSPTEELSEESSDDSSSAEKEREDSSMDALDLRATFSDSADFTPKRFNTSSEYLPSL